MVNPTFDVFVIQEQGTRHVVSCPICGTELARGDILLAVVSDEPPASVVAQLVTCCGSDTATPFLFTDPGEANEKLSLLEESLDKGNLNLPVMPGQLFGIENLTRDDCENLPKPYKSH